MILRHFLLLLLLISCSEKEKEYDKAKAVSAFAIIDPLRVDPKLENVEIKLPKQQENQSWFSANDLQNRAVENIAFNFPKNNKLKKAHSVWSGLNFKFDDRFVFSPIITEDKVFLLDGSGVVEAYNLKTKKCIWKSRAFTKNFLKNYQIPKLGYAQGKVFAVAGINQIVALDEVDGKILWSKFITAIPLSTPVSDGSKVYITTNDNRLYAFNVSDGELQWVQSGIARLSGIFGAANPVIYNDLVIAAYSSGEIYAVNKKTGETAWVEDLNLNRAISSDFYLNDVDATPIIKNGVVYAIGNGGLMKAINANNGNHIWRKEVAGIVDFWISGEFIFVINNDNKLLALYKKTGAVKWVMQLPDLLKLNKPETKILYSGVVMAGDKLLITSARGELLIASAMDGKIEKTIDIDAQIFHTPIIVNKKIYLHTIGKYLIELIELQ